MTRISDSGLSVAVVGATGQVGAVMREILAERAFPIRELRLFATARSAGTSVEFAGQTVVIEDVATADPSGIDIALFSAGATASRAHAPRFAEAGAVVIDNSSALAHGSRGAAGRERGQPARDRAGAQGHHRQPELHDDGRDAGAEAARRRGRSRAPHRLDRTRRCRARAGRCVRSCSARSRASSRRATRCASSATAPPSTSRSRRSTSQPIAFDVIPLAGSLVEDGLNETDEEKKLRNESRKILELPDLRVAGTCVRVPVFTGHSLSIHAEFAP